MHKQEEEFLAAREAEIREAQMRGEMGQPYSAAMFGGQQKQNLVEWQLDFRPELEDIERLLRSDIIASDKDGNEVWVRNPNPDYVVFNDLGVNDIIRQIRMFLNKNKVLSNYGLEEIKPRVQMLGHELRALIYNNYENYGIDNEYKMNNYPIIVLTILDMIDSAYRRAINGEERRDLNQARVVQQNEPMMPQNINFYPGMEQQRRGVISRMMPWNWGKR
jgi:hypothetical protein